MSGIKYIMNGQRTKIECGNGTGTSYEYDERNHRLKRLETRNAKSILQTKYTDASGNIVKVVEGGAVTTRYEYDSLNQLKTITDAEGNVTVCEYDIGGRRTSTDNPDTGRVTYTYDSANNLTGKSTPEQRAAGATTQYRYSYNRLERVIRKTMPDVVYTYGKKSNANTAGRVAKVQNGYATDEYEYDWLGNVVKSTRKIKKISTGAEKTYKTYSRYDWYGRLLSVTYPDGETVTYGYDGGGNVISASGTEAYVKNILYNEHGQRTEIDYGNNVVTKYAYDDENLRLKTIETTKGGRTIQSLTYDYDDTGNVTRRSNDGFQTKDDNRKFAEHNYEYDSLNRLVKAKGSYTRSGLIIDNMLQKYDTKYDYTPGGNISRKKQSAWGVGTEGNSITDVNLSYDNEYKYDSPKPHAVTKVGSTEYTYDLDGRMTGSY
ncbi:MAG: RHS repeat protein, partial [Spirochaetes bacterium]|nr:RHS repeat protein [Spirochaetota bacterium]